MEEEIVQETMGELGDHTDVWEEQPEEVVEEPIIEEETVEPTEPAEQVSQGPELFELPDGRKVDADTLYREHTQNLLPEFTRRSQELAELKKQATPLTTPETNWVPDSYEEILSMAEQRAIKAIEDKQNAVIQQRQEVENIVVGQLNTLKTIDPTLNENALFVHANKYGFKDLIAAHKNMRDMNDAIKATQKMTAQNIAKRSDAVSFSPQASGSRPDPSQFSTARDYLNSLHN